jgi:hypothetical protein
MPLPKVELATGAVQIAGETVSFHALSRSAAVQLASYQNDPDEGEVFIIAEATGETMDDVRAWRRSVDVDTVGPLVDAIVALSGLSDEGPKAGKSASNGSSSKASSMRSISPLPSVSARP